MLFNIIWCSEKSKKTLLRLIHKAACSLSKLEMHKFVCSRAEAFEDKADDPRLKIS